MPHARGLMWPFLSLILSSLVFNLPITSVFSTFFSLSLPWISSTNMGWSQHLPDPSLPHIFPLSSLSSHLSMYVHRFLLLLWSLSFVDWYFLFFFFFFFFLLKKKMIWLECDSVTCPPHMNIVCKQGLVWFPWPQNVMQAMNHHEWNIHKFSYKYIYMFICWLWYWTSSMHMPLMKIFLPHSTVTPTCIFCFNTKHHFLWFDFIQFVCLFYIVFESLTAIPWKSSDQEFLLRGIAVLPNWCLWSLRKGLTHLRYVFILDIHTLSAFILLHEYAVLLVSF